MQDIFVYNNHEIRFIMLAIFIGFLAGQFHQDVPLVSQLNQPIPQIIFLGIIIYVGSFKFEYGFLLALIYFIAYSYNLPIQEFVV